jgi:hypothetical protein
MIFGTARLGKIQAQQSFSKGSRKGECLTLTGVIGQGRAFSFSGPNKRRQTMKNRKLRGEILSRFDTLTDFARVLGIKENQLSRIIHGRDEVPLEQKETISAKLGVPVERIFPQNQD